MGCVLTGDVLERCGFNAKSVSRRGVRLTQMNTSIPETNSMRPEVPIDKAEDNSKDDAHNVCDPVVYVCAAVKGRLDKFDHTSEGTRPEKYREQSKAASSGEGEG